MTSDEREIAGADFARVMNALLGRPANEPTPEPDAQAQERAQLRRQILDLLAGQTPELDPPGGTSVPPEPEPPPIEPRDAFAALLGARLNPTDKET